MSKLFQVKSQETAEAMGSGELPVLATPALVAFVENTCKELNAAELETGQTSVGIEINLQHVKASKVGAYIKVEAQVSERSRTVITYEFEAYDQGELVGRGSHKRAIVDIESFLSRL